MIGVQCQLICKRCISKLFWDRKFHGKIDMGGKPNHAKTGKKHPGADNFTSLCQMMAQYSNGCKSHYNKFDI